MDKAGADEFADFAQSRWSRLVRLAYGITGDRGLADRLFGLWPPPRHGQAHQHLSALCQQGAGDGLEETGRESGGLVAGDGGW